MVEIKHAYRRGKKGTWWFRLRIPAKVKSYYPPKKKEFTQSLETTDPATAKLLVDKLISQYNAEFEKLLSAGNTDTPTQQDSRKSPSNIFGITEYSKLVLKAAKENAPSKSHTQLTNNLNSLKRLSLKLKGALRHPAGFSEKLLQGGGCGKVSAP